MRFSHTATSEAAEQFLSNTVRRFLPAYPDEAILPLCVSKLPHEDTQLVQERMQGFSSYVEHPRTARRRMGKLFAMASAALAAQVTIADDRSTHQVVYNVPSLDSIPVRLHFTLPAMTTEGGWTRTRPPDIWVVDSNIVLRTRVAEVYFSVSELAPHVELHSEARTHTRLRNAARRFGTVDTEMNSATLPVCVRLARLSSGTDPVVEFFASDNLSALLRPAEQSLAYAILDAVYASPPRPTSSDDSHSPPAAPPLAVRYRSQTLHFRQDQARAVQMGTGTFPLLAIQAPPGTGKTLVRATTAARLSTPGQLIIVTATTNVAMPRFADLLLGLEEYRQHCTVLRFVGGTALQEGTPTTPVDLHRVLCDLLVNYSDTLSTNEQERLHRYSRGRRLFEKVLLHPEATLHMTEEERDEYRIAESHNPIATEQAVGIMFRVRYPTILCITVSSLLNSTKSSGIFHNSLFGCRVIIADEASQIPEPAFVALTAHFPSARHIYIGDVYQLQPHTRSPRSSLATQLGGKEIVDLLMQKDVPLALVHSSLWRRANQRYTSSLSNTPVTRPSLPNPALPLVVVNVEGSSRVTHTQSHSNEEEADCCIELIQFLLDRNIQSSSVAIITFYKDQKRLLADRAAHLGVRLHTVDSVQGHEMDPVIILTTRTHLDHVSGEFLDDLRRINVATTRCRHGQFILGHVAALRSLTNWARLLQWTAAQNIIVDRSSLPDFFVEHMNFFPRFIPTRTFHRF